MKKSEFIRQCKANKDILEFTYEDICECLDNVSVEEYKNFEDGKIDLSESNIEIITRLLCIEEGNSFLLDDYIDLDGVSEDVIDDLKQIVEEIVGDFDA